MNRASILVATALVLSGLTAAAVPTVSLDRNPAPRYERLEMTVTYGTAYTNRFDPAEVDLHGDFVSPSGRIIRVNGFWDGSAWKIRFAGSEVGSYSYTVSFVDGGGTHSAAPGTFNVTNSPDHGWVRVSQGDTHYLAHDDGAPFYGVGFCRPWNVEGVPNLFPTMKSNGCNTLVYWLPIWDHSLLRNAEGYDRYNMTHAAAIDAVMAAAESNDVKVIFTVWNHDFLRDSTHYMYRGDPSPDNPYQYNPFHVLASASDWFTNVTCQTYARNYYRYLIARWGYSRALGMWQTITEIDLTNASDTYDGLWAANHLNQARLDAWHASLNNYFKQNDPFGHPTHAARSDAGDWPGGMSVMDITGGHAYPALDLISTRGDVKYPAMLAYGKPCFLSECGLRVSEGETNRTAFQHLAAWSGLVTGGGLTPMMWCDGGGEWGNQTTTMFEQMKHFRNFTDTLDLTGQGFAKRSITHTVPGGRGWCLGGSRQHIVWIEDQTPGETISGAHVTIAGMSTGVYEVKVYNTWSGTWYAAYNANVGGSTLAIPLPDFQKDIAVRVAPAAVASVPELSTPTHSSIQPTQATLGATITGDGGAAITARGTTWGTSAGPTGNRVAEGGTAVGAFTQVRTGLPAGTHLYYRGYAVNSAGTGYSPGGEFYTEPATPSSGIGFADVASNSMRITWTSGSGMGRIVVVRQGTDVDAAPVDGTEHAANPAFGSGAQLGTSNYVVYRSAGSQVVVTGLSPGAIYHVAIYEYAGSAGLINYRQTSPAVGSQRTVGARYPFPQAVTYPYGIKPNSRTQAQMDAECQQTYELWKTKCLTQSGAGTPPGAWRVQVDQYTTGDTVSEGIGYGMLITVYMDNATNNTQPYFDGLWQYYNAYLDSRGLMHWAINADGSLAGQNAATDADEDVALALIMADKQWGSSGNVNYLQAARDLLVKVAQYEISTNGVLKPGDSWGNPPVNPSYFAPAAYRIFYEVTGESKFDLCIDECYSTINYFHGAHATALVPDWCTAAGAQSGTRSYEYSWDACRTPWRIGNDYLWYGASNSALAYNWCNKLSTWIKGKTTNNAANIDSGYTLAGAVTEGYNKAPFVGPFGVAAMVDPSHQDWCNNVWNRLEVVGDNIYYHLSIKMLTELLMSGNMPNLFAEGPPAASAPALSSPTVSSIDTTAATLGATVTGDGGASITARGTTWGTSADPTGNKVAEGGTAVGAFTQTRTGLPAGTHLYYRGYAVNSAGTGYSPDSEFYTEPATPPAGVGFSNIASNRMRITWTSGSGTGRIVVVRQGSAVDAAPADGTEHAASPVFGGGAQLSTSNYVVYRSTGSQVDITGLSPGTVYHVAIYEYAGSGELVNYRQASPATASQATTGRRSPVLFADSFNRATSEGAEEWTPGELAQSNTGMTDNVGLYLLHGTNTYLEGESSPSIVSNRFSKGTQGMAGAGLNYDFVNRVLSVVSGGVYNGKRHLRVSMDTVALGGTSASDPWDRFSGFGIGYTYSSICDLVDMNATTNPLRGLRPGHNSNGVQNVTGAPGALFFSYEPITDAKKTNALISVYADNVATRRIHSGAPGALAVDFYFDAVAAGSNVAYVITDTGTPFFTNTYTLVNSENYVAFGGRANVPYGAQLDNLEISTSGGRPVPPEIDMFGVSGTGTVSIGWTDVGGAYHVQWTTNLVDPVWLPAAGGGPTATNGWSGAAPSGPREVFHRVWSE